MAHGQRPDPRDTIGEPTGDSGLPGPDWGWKEWCVVAVVVAAMIAVGSLPKERFGYLHMAIGLGILAAPFLLYFL